MHHGPASEVQRAQTTIGADPTTFAPYPMGQGVIDERGPEERKHQEAAELHPLGVGPTDERSEEHTSELQSLAYLVCRLLLEKKKKHRSTKTDEINYTR